MKQILKSCLHSGRFMTGFVIFVILLGIAILYPIFHPGDPLKMIGQNSFVEPGTYVSLYDANTVNLNGKTSTFTIDEAGANRAENNISQADRQTMLDYLTAAGVDVSGMDTSHESLDRLIEAWQANYDSKAKIAGFTTSAKKRDLRAINSRLDAAMKAGEQVLVTKDGDEEVQTKIADTAYVRTDQVANTITLTLGTDNFGRDMMKELASAIGTSLIIGLIAGTIATLLGLIIGLLSGYLGGIVDDILMFVCNVFTVIPGFVLLILIYYSVGQEARGVTTCAIVIGITSWVWTARSVRSQVISLRNRDHVNLSKLSGHSLFRIIISDILPYIASYVVMAFILQVSSGILAEAQLSLLGLGPKTTTTPTLGLMMNWSMLYNAHTQGYWWAYFPVIAVIALTSFSLNLMNTGLDQVFNPTLRD